MSLIKQSRWIAALFLTFGIAVSANAGLITYDYKTTLSFASGADALGLNGAVIEIKVDVSSTAVYVNRFGLPAVVLNNDGTLTITGSSQAANNGSFALSQLAFYPTFAGLYTENPAGTFASVVLPVGGSLTLEDKTNPTAHAPTVAVGDVVSLSDFVPASSRGLQFVASNGANYDQVNPVITATLTGGTAVPEPATLGLLGFGLFGIAMARRGRKVDSSPASI